MNIIGTQYTLKTRTFEIYIAGCRGIDGRHCKGCHNPESWNFDNGDKYDCNYFKNNIKTPINNFDSLVDNIMVFGGEPLDNDHKEVIDLLIQLNTLNKKVWLFTRYSIKEISDNIKELCDYIKCGAYIPELSTDTNIQYGIKLATSNQIIYKKGVDY